MRGDKVSGQYSGPIAGAECYVHDRALRTLLRLAPAL